MIYENSYFTVRAKELFHILLCTVRLPGSDVEFCYRLSCFAFISSFQPSLSSFEVFNVIMW